MQSSLNIIEANPHVLTVLSAICLFSEKSAFIFQIENRTALDTDDIEDTLSFLEEHSYIKAGTEKCYSITEKGLQYVNEKTYSDFKLK